MLTNLHLITFIIFSTPFFSFFLNIYFLLSFHKMELSLHGGYEVQRHIKVLSIFTLLLREFILNPPRTRRTESSVNMEKCFRLVSVPVSIVWIWCLAYFISQYGRIKQNIPLNNKVLLKDIISNSTDRMLFYFGCGI